VCGCTPETDTAFCTHYGAQCGAKSGVDNCGQNRTVASCGTCAGTGETCGGGAQPAANVCGCTTETDAQFCTRLGAECGQKSGTDNCGQSRTVTSCGACANSGTCSASNTCASSTCAVGLSVQSTWTQSTPGVADSADLNGDGREDLVVKTGRESESYACVYINSPSGLGSCVSYNVQGDGSAVALGDVSGDGVPDMVVSGYNNNTISVFVNQGAGTFGSPQVLAGPGAGCALSLRVADVDADGKGDILSTDLGTSTLSVYRHAAGGGFLSGVTYALRDGANNMDVGDLNGDGRPDVAVVSYNASNVVSVLLNNGDGTFGARVDYAVASEPGSVRIGDMNGDRAADLVVASGSGAAISVFLNSGTGTFGQPIRNTLTVATAVVELADFNLDGRLDVATVTGAGSGRSIALLTNDGTGNLALMETLALAAPSTGNADYPSLFAFDVDSDGDRDLLVSRFASNQLNLVRNACQSVGARAGINDCGSSNNDLCKLSPRVSGGTYYRGTTTAYPATVSTFRLDKYEVTVGRFRKFVDAWLAGWRPTAGSGKHTHVNGGLGLAVSGGGYESGWSSSWSAYVGAPSASAVAPTAAGASSRAEWDTNLTQNCSNTATWTSAPGANERRPQNCVSWYDLYAFCIWDGGFLPSEAEWEYAAAGGSEERLYPWGNDAPTQSRAIFNQSAPVDVGSAPAGNGRWGQSDLSGNVWEWNLDWFQATFGTPCVNCIASSGTSRVVRGGAAGSDATPLAAADRGTAAGYNLQSPAFRLGYAGRCARSP
jgi:formylglycine-generating enzyme required for sulfatase activity